MKTESPNSPTSKKNKVWYLFHKGEEMRYEENIVMAKLYLEKARKLGADVADQIIKASILESLGFCYSAGAEYEKAIKTTNDAIAAFKRLSGERGQLGQGNCLVSVGTIFKNLGKYEEAMPYYENGLEILLRLRNKNPLEVSYEMMLGNAYGNMGEFHNEIKKHEQAIELCQEALKIFKKAGNKLEEARALHNTGIAYTGMGNFKQCIEYCEKSAHIFKEIGNKQGLLDSYQVLANNYRYIGKIDISKRYFESCIANDIHLDMNQLTDLAMLYGNRGLLDYEIALTQFLNFRDAKESFERCIDSFKLSIETTDKILDRLSEDSNLTAFSDRFYRWYDHLTAPFILSGRSTAALLCLDLGRAKILRNFVYQQVKRQVGDKVKSSFESSWKTIENGNEKEIICSLTREIQLSESNATVLFYNFNRAGIFTIWVIDACGCVSLKSSDPIDTNFSTSYEELVDNIKTVLEKTSVRLSREYSFFDHLKAPDLEEMNANKFTCRPHSSEEKVRERTNHNGRKEKMKDGKNEFRAPAKGVDKSCGDDLTKEARSRLYKALIDPVKSLIKGTKLILVPQRSLFFVPFSSLVDENGSLLSEKYQIQIIPSVHVLASSMQTSSGKRIGGSLFVGNPNCESVQLPSLPSAADEVEYLASLLGAKPLTEHMASKSKVMNLMSDASIIHIAAHGQEGTGHIFLAPESKKSNDGAHPISSSHLLTQSDVLKCKLSARLVVLSCCHSGRGKISSEGVLGIARSFLGAGAKSVLVTLWAINDLFTQKFMKVFYEKILEETSACMALKETMNNFQKIGQYDSFLYWAAFEILGEDVSFTKGEIAEIQRRNKDVKLV
jgi:CHAT domain-containing protein/tetratricopeptide (TPR) repeat protein